MFWSVVYWSVHLVAHAITLTKKCIRNQRWGLSESRLGCWWDAGGLPVGSAPVGYRIILEKCHCPSRGRIVILSWLLYSY